MDNDQTKRRERRWRYWANSEIQGGLCLRVLIYWLLCQLSVLGTIAAFKSLSSGQASSSSFFLQAMTFSSLIFVFAVFDIIKYSNRFVGPMVNLKLRLEKVSETGKWQDVKFRRGDCHQEIAEAANNAFRRLQAEKQIIKSVPVRATQNTSAEKVECNV